VESVDGLRLLAPADTTVVCFTGPDLFALADELTARGWHTQPQLRYGDIPASIHLTVTAAVAPQVPSFGPDLAAAVAAVGPVSLPDGVLEMVASLPPSALSASVVEGLAGALGLGAAGGSAGPLPDRVAAVNTLLNAASPAVRERLLAEFLSLLQRPTY
jgi:sphinganine-1-phosphate aldolase